jgi:hypothetical protein
MPEFSFDKPCEFWNARTHRKFTIGREKRHLTFMSVVDLKLTAQGMKNFPPELQQDDFEFVVGNPIIGPLVASAWLQSDGENVTSDSLQHQVDCTPSLSARQSSR